MATFSFDIVSEYNKAEMNNVFASVQKEISNRYDFKGTPAEINWLGDKTGFKIIGANEWQIDSIIDIIRKKLTSHSQSSKILNIDKKIVINNMKATKEIPFVAGLDQDKAKQIVKLIRDNLPKIKTQIQGESIRVTGNNKDDLQTAIKLIESHDFNFPIIFNNYR
ncbi:MAG: cyclic-di-GMP-binding protein [Patescibacteria group bacterium]|nr:cyclic-di-GMP-binding protein [Patescibacteria group bacterium]